ncbi:putative replication protein; mobile element region [Bacillus amyloliquefaciens XH7]|nr:putative replication protein; mobile element region [Bacillus amyloliquefaciens XH7]
MSKKSEAYLCFYEKNYEQAEKYNIPLEELEIRIALTLVAMQIINNYVRFVDADEEVTREHWKTSLFWSEFIGDVGKLQLYMKPQRDFYQKTRNWPENSCSPTMIMEAELSEKQEKMLDVFFAEVADMVFRGLCLSNEFYRMSIDRDEK